MENRTRLIVAWALGLVSGGALTLALAQAPMLDPARVAPHIFEVLLDNDRVRVLKVIDRNGETQPVHTHPDRVVVYLSPCAWLVEEADGSARMVSYRFGDVYWEDALTHGGRTSAVVQECRSVEIELKEPSAF
ncbi:MAG: cytoplasmic protein [Gammaproteobacteria bacterium]|nr:cytoplasmic protein [Gammaproteobacteria bacterium]MDH4254178.1 cytoplasmic protein [Gammaproteobacteria bacterium]MDH5309972.1 cytoplasmic protein [Gammaproteobacteria bacterium]